MELPGYVFLITPPANANEGEFEKSLAKSLQKIAHAFTHRMVSGTSQTLIRGRDEKEGRNYLWTLELVLVSAERAPFGVVGFTGLLAELKELVGPNGKVSFVAAVEATVKP